MARDLHEFDGDTWSIGEDDDALPVRKLGQVCWPARVNVEDWLLGAEDHSRHLAHALATARETVFIASAFLAADVVRLVAPTILAAVARGVVVDVLWGYGATREAIEELKRIAYEVKRDRLHG